jgi:type II secretory pathway pseudopilin PulG
MPSPALPRRLLCDAVPRRGHAVQNPGRSPLSIVASDHDIYRAPRTSADPAGRGIRQGGFALVEIVLVLAVVAVAGYLLMQYVNSTTKTTEMLQQERPIDRSRLAADRATLASVQSAVRTYQAEKGHWPPDKAAVVTLLMVPPRFQCGGNDFEYDPASGALSLTITDDARCAPAR